MRRLLWGLLAVGLVGAAVVPAYSWGIRRLNEYYLAHARVALAAEQYDRAESLACRVLARCSDRKASMVAGEAAMLAGRIDDALAYFQPLLEGSDPDTVVVLAAAADLYSRKGNAAEAERLYRRAIELDPQQVFAKRKLALLLTQQGRNREALPLRFELAKSGEVNILDLLMLGDPRGLAEGEDVDFFERMDSANPWWWLARAQLLAGKGQAKAARDLFEKVVAVRPENPEAQAGLGMALMDIGTPRGFWKWTQDVPKSAEQHPDYWMALGLWAKRHKQIPAAARCFWEALQLDPTYHQANYHLSVALTADGKPEQAKLFEDVATQTMYLKDAIENLYAEDLHDVALIREMAERTEKLGRYWESLNWRRMLLLEVPQDIESQHAVGRLQARLSPDAPRVDPAFDHRLRLDLSSYPLPQIDEPPVASVVNASNANTNHDAIRFGDVTQSSGLDFAYFPGDDPTTPSRRMFEFTGGGIAVLDYDCDGWPDLYFTQGIHWPRREGQPVLRDQLFRNLGDGRFANVTEQAGLGDDRFGQGVASGDYNSDGYPDLYLGNVGVNRLYRNNGDGTFVEVTEEAGVGGDLWTTSTLIADLSGDGIPDLYEVNYLSGKIDELPCRQTCNPEHYPAADDRFFLGQGDGTFLDQSIEAGFVAPDGKGLGLAALDFNDSGQLSLFVSNDTTANFLFVNDQPRGAAPNFTESAVLRGVAFDRDGYAQASMGIAVDDANGDGLLDVCVANFYHEFNTLYQQLPGGFFADVSRECGLAEPSFAILTFGMQFMDIDLDGYPDLINATGHVDDLRAEGKPYYMPPHISHNVGNGQFVDLCKSCGPFFEGEYLGRGMATLDWNRDGKGDWVVSHLDSPSALLENQSEPCGNYLALSFIGTRSERDAIGTTCWLTVGGRTIVQQLVGGSGYYASNEKLLIFGLGNETGAERLEVRWPDGSRQTFDAVEGNRTYRLIEDTDLLYPRPRDAVD